ncbi:hypothetical protein JW887_07105 [Candidatus Dojkabacteria bacterium]|nr:hypothetical protein [Candidatus Dojkabacteria bacterium]
MKVLIIDGKEYLHGRNVAIEYEIPYSTFKKYLYESNIDYELFSGSHWYEKEIILPIARRFSQYQKIKKEYIAK